MTLERLLAWTSDPPLRTRLPHGFELVPTVGRMRPAATCSATVLSDRSDSVGLCTVSALMPHLADQPINNAAIVFSHLPSVAYRVSDDPCLRKGDPGLSGQRRFLLRALRSS